MESIGKGIGTAGIWGGLAAAIAFSGDANVAVAILGSICATIATGVIWSSR